MRFPGIPARAARPWLALLDLAEAQLMPRRCPFCGTNLHTAGRPVCLGCLGDLPVNSSACRACAMPLGRAADAVCARCQARPRFRRVIAPYRYEYPLDAAIRALKFGRKLFYLPAFARLLLQAAAALPEDVDAVLPVPLHRRRLVTRGFNQAFELARPIAPALGLPLIHEVVRHRHTPYQSGLAPAERRRNLRGAFRMRGRLDARHVLIIDDVVTTGATCSRLAALLRRNGVQEVSVLALARALGD